MTPSTYQTNIYTAFQTDAARLICNAVAGSGKTTTLVEQVKKLDPMDRFDTIFTCFNVDIRDALAAKLPQGTNVSNFHRVGKQITETGCAKPQNAKGWVNKNKYWNITQNLLIDRDFKPDDDEQVFTSAKNAVNYCQLTLTDPFDSKAFGEMLDTYEIQRFDGIEEVVSDSMREGVKRAKTGIDIDFNDMIWLPTVLDLPRARYSNVFIDECQDLNAAQRTLALSLAKEDSRVMAVGDPRQAIYGFAGADHNSFGLVQDAIGAKEMPLSICYRCPVSHVELAKEIVPQIEAAPGAKVGILEDMSYAQMTAHLSPRNGYGTGDIVLCRVTAQLVRLAFELIAKRIPAKLKGRDIMGGLVAMAKTVLKGKPRANWADLKVYLAEYVRDETARIQKVPHPSNDARIAAMQDRAEALEVLHEASIGEGIRDHAGFSRWVYRFFDEQVNGAVTLSTVHKAKGGEWDRVFILDPEIMPHPMASTEAAMIQEYNLLYVARTRSKNALYLVDKKPR